MPNPNPPRRTARTTTPTLPPRTSLRNPRTGTYKRNYRDPLTGQDRSIYGPLAVVAAFDPNTAPPKLDRTLTLAAYLRLWVDGLETRTNTNAYHAGNVERYLIPRLGERVRLAELAPEHVRSAFAQIREHAGKRGRLLSARTVASIHATLRRALAQAVADGRIERNVAIGIRPNGTSGVGSRGRRLGSELVIPTDAELRAVAAALKPAPTLPEDPLYPLFMLSALTGLRQSEALALRWSDLHDAGGVGGVVRVERTLVRDSERFEDPKTARSRRGVPYDTFLGDILRARRQAQRVEQLAAGKRWANRERDLIFTDELGAPLRGTSVSNRYAARIDRLGIDHRWHDLRHAYASGLIARGESIEIVSKRLGHADSSITSRIYVHIIAEPADRTAAAAAAMFTS
jgi:integrase